MRFAVIQCVNGNFSVLSEHGTNLQAAKVAFHDRCKVLWNAVDVITATVKIVDENMTCVENYVETITHPIVESEAEG